MTELAPGYLDLFRSGELKRRVDTLWARLAACDICPRECGVNRLAGEHGFCHAAEKPVVSSYCAHHGEEPPLSGTRGSGTIFFGNCNMRCVYCQNFQISQDWRSQRQNEIDVTGLAERMLSLQDVWHCHNINLVTPSHFVPQILQAVLEAVPHGLHLPLVYNTSGYDALATVQALDGIISIYLPDLRYADNKLANKYSRAPDYVERARAAIREMHRQVGILTLDEAGIAEHGLIVRHLIMPGDIAGSEASLRWLAEEISPRVAVSIMSQYSPQYRAGQFPELSRCLTYQEYQRVAALVEKLGLVNGWLQETAAPEYYLPDFRREGHPFEAK